MKKYLNVNSKKLEEMTEEEKRAELLKRIDFMLSYATDDIIVFVWEVLIRIIK